MARTVESHVQQARNWLNGQCVLCEQETYQDETGQTSCKACPFGTTTNSTGNSAISACSEVCDVAYTGVSVDLVYTQLPYNDVQDLYYVGIWASNYGYAECTFKRLFEYTLRSIDPETIPQLQNWQFGTMSLISNAEFINGVEYGYADATMAWTDNETPFMPTNSVMESTFCVNTVQDQMYTTTTPRDYS